MRTQTLSGSEAVEKHGIY